MLCHYYGREAGLELGEDCETVLEPGQPLRVRSPLQRLPIITLDLIGFLIARQLAAYQMGHVGGVWESFPPGERAQNGTETIITSEVSQAWPVPDAALGAVTYLLEVLMGVMGDRRRWRTMPWMAVLFGIVVVPLGVVSTSSSSRSSSAPIARCACSPR